MLVVTNALWLGAVLPLLQVYLEHSLRLGEPALCLPREPKRAPQAPVLLSQLVVPELSKALLALHTAPKNVPGASVRKPKKVPQQ